ncbi:MAG: pilus assembly protein [Kiritimatiellae bacterium]|nr:pilus assembly protein [Kiritimatiellia bacterium]
MKTNKKRSGQAMVEYIIIVVLIAIAAIAVFGYFGGAITKKTAGATSALDEDLGSEAASVAGESTADTLKNLDEDGNY